MTYQSGDVMSWICTRDVCIFAHFCFDRWYVLSIQRLACFIWSTDKDNVSCPFCTNLNLAVPLQRKDRVHTFRVKQCSLTNMVT